MDKLKNIIEKAKTKVMPKVLTLTMIGSSLFGQGWGHIQPAYQTKTNNATVRLEGSFNVGKSSDVYGFIDLTSGKENTIDLENTYFETRLTKNIGNVGVAIEVNGGMGFKDVWRAGATWKPNLGEKNFTLLKYLPISTGENGQQISAYSSQDLTEKISVSGLLDYNINSKSVYGEAQLSLKLNDKVKMFVQDRVSKTIGEKANHNLVIGINYDF